MHKYFTKTLFVGKQAFYMPSCHSTNSIAADFIRSGKASEGLVIYTGHQTAGRGQMGNVWESAPDSNLLMSLVMEPHFIIAQDQFMLSRVCSLAVYDTLSTYLPLDFRIKWPNDLFQASHKLAGILIENILQGNRIAHSIWGIGLNVNQTQFAQPHANSMALLAGHFFDVEEVLETLLLHIEKWYLALRSGGYGKIIKAYHEVLYRKGELLHFETASETFEGSIIEVSNEGRLCIRKNGGGVLSFGIKEISYR